MMAFAATPKRKPGPKPKLTKPVLIGLDMDGEMVAWIDSLRRVGKDPGRAQTRQDIIRDILTKYRQERGD